MSIYDQLMDRILGYFASGSFRQELEAAKQDYFGKGVTLDEQSVLFHSRMSQFFDWYFYTRELNGYGQTPLESYKMVRDLRFTSEEEEVLERMRNHRHSLFEFVKMKGDDIYLKDLLRDEKIIVSKSPLIYGFNEEEIFETRLVREGDRWVFCRGFCFHPGSVKKYILTEVKKYRKDSDLDPEVLMMKLVRMRSRCEQYRHLRPEMVYSDESKLTL